MKWKLFYMPVDEPAEWDMIDPIVQGISSQRLTEYINTRPDADHVAEVHIYFYGDIRK